MEASHSPSLLATFNNMNFIKDESTMLFTLKNATQAQDVISGIESIKTGSAGGPIS